MHFTWVYQVTDSLQVWFTFQQVMGKNVKIPLWVNRDGIHCNHCTERLVILMHRPTNEPWWHTKSKVSLTYFTGENPTSTPVIRTVIIPTCRSPSPPVVASLSHGPCDCQASLSHLANNRPMHYRFFTFCPRGLTPGQSSPKGEKTWWTPRSTILQNFIALHQLTP